MELHFSIIIPVYNRPNEIDELLNSLTKQTFSDKFEVIIVEDGSLLKSDKIIFKYQDLLNIKYFEKENTGAGLSRNFGMQQATGNYFIIFDSDCVIPKNYLTEVAKALKLKYTDAFGGADAAHEDFTNLQKAINYSMTSFLTTGGIRGSKIAVNKFQPRSFNFGISKSAFVATGGFSSIKIGEDIDLTLRLWEKGFETQFVEKGYVYHKRRTSIKQFFNQTFAFGKARPLLNKKYPKSSKLTYWFPSLFIAGLLFSISCLFFELVFFVLIYLIYLMLLFIDSFIENTSIKVAGLSVLTTLVQFTGYGLGFILGLFKNINLLSRSS